MTGIIMNIFYLAVRSSRLTAKAHKQQAVIRASDLCLSFISLTCLSPPSGGVGSPLYQALFNPIICSLCCLTTTVLPRTPDCWAEQSKVLLCRHKDISLEANRYLWRKTFLVSPVFKKRSPQSSWGSRTAFAFAESALMTCSHPEKEKKNSIIHIKAASA